VTQEVVEEALEKLRPGFDADGFDLQLRTLAEDGTVEIVLTAKPAACTECLVPDHMLVQLIDRAIRDRDPSLREVVLVKVGFDGPLIA
jgi:Fe-S cluster biogenesis protein NfuA